jgi:urease accessory protein
MRAAARVVAEADGAGGTRLAVLASDVPLVLRQTGPAQVHLVGGAAGPLGGDELALSIVVGTGAALCVRTVAATLALPGRGGTESRMRVSATVAEGGYLAWLPEPLVAVRGCRHLAESIVDIAGDARLAWREELVCGRHGEPPGDVRVRTTVRRGGRPLVQQELAIGPHAPGWDGPAVLGGARVAGTFLVVDPAWAPDGPPGARVLGPTAALLPLAGPAVLASVTGADAHEVRTGLAELTERWAPRT